MGTGKQVDLTVARAALGVLAGSFRFSAHDAGGGATVTCARAGSLPLGELLADAKRRLERAGISAMQVGGSLYLASPETAAVSRATRLDPWHPDFCGEVDEDEAPESGVRFFDERDAPAPYEDDDRQQRAAGHDVSGRWA